MKPLNALRLLLFALLIAASVLAQSPAPKPAPKPAPVEDAAGAYYFDPQMLSSGLLLEAPPAADSAVSRAELAELHAIEKSRTPAQVAAAQQDDREEDIFSFRTVLGPGFDPARLPVTAAFSAHVHGEEGAASLPLKTLMHRARPYQADPTLHPVCKLTDKPNSYPSGHSISGWLEAFTLIRMVPERSAEILARAEDYAHNRLICGVHYRSDLEASHRVALLVFGYLEASPRFERDLALATAETRAAIGLPPLKAAELQ